MTGEDVVRRARSAIGHGTRYKLGAGGTNPNAPHPATGGACDCSGFTAWALGVSRQTSDPLYRDFNGGWINTDAMVHDATRPGGLFTRLSTPRVGALAVYGRRGAGSYGHCGVISAVEGGRIAKVIHCSSGNDRNGDAIQETGPAVFEKPDVVFAWFDGLDVGAEPAPLAVRPLRTWAVVTASSLNVRRDPSTARPHVNTLAPGTRVIVDGVALAGQNVQGNPIWLRTVDGLWVWAGGTDLPAPRVA